MPPTRILRDVKTRAMPVNSQAKNNDQNIAPLKKGGKRKAEANSPVHQDKVKRSALGNLTNAVVNNGKDALKALKPIGNTIVKREHGVIVPPPPLKKPATTVSTNAIMTRQSLLAVVKKESQKGFQAPQNVAVASVTKVEITGPIISHGHLEMAPRPTKVITRAAARAVQSKPTQANATIIKKEKETLESGSFKVTATRRISNEFEKSKTDDETLYMSAMDSCGSSSLSSIASQRSFEFESPKGSDFLPSVSDIIDHIDNQFSVAPAGVVDFDKENWDDPYQVSHYSMDIFNYLKSREKAFKISSYITKQIHISKWMRSLLVDWMVEVQETFELNHETLYLAVKIVDLYLGKVVVIKDKLQLLGAAALFMACKYDERTPPMIDDFLYICDGAYVQKELIFMEMDVLKTIDYDLGIPLSYRFLRRYARCSKVPMSILTLARYILEFSLMDYETITLSDSKMASAALFMALRMNNKPSWDKTLEYYTGYELKHFAKIVVLLNAGLHQKPRDAIKTVRNKYTHKIFFEVAKTPLLSTDAFFENTDIEFVDNDVTINV